MRPFGLLPMAWVRRGLVALLVLVGAGCWKVVTPPPPVDTYPFEGETLPIEESKEPPRRQRVTCPAPGSSPESLRLRASCVGVKSGRARDVTSEVLWKTGNPLFLTVGNGDHGGGRS